MRAAWRSKKLNLNRSLPCPVKDNRKEYTSDPEKTAGGKVTLGESAVKALQKTFIVIQKSIKAVAKRAQTARGRRSNTGYMQWLL
jgi:hypothetical protein